MDSARKLALKALVLVEKGEKSNEVTDRLLQSARFPDERDRAFFTRLVLETLQNRMFLDYAINNISTISVLKMRPQIRNLLRLSACQLCFFDGIPVSAVCSEAVNLAKAEGFGSLSGFVNAICRRLSESIREMHKQADIELKYSIPKVAANEIRTQFDKDRANDIMAGFSNSHAPLTARLLLSKADENQIIKLLSEQNITTEKVSFAENAIYLHEHPAPGEIRAFTKGLIQFQDLTSILAVEAAHIKKGDRVLDLCAAPGGKTIAAADNCGPNGYVVSCDISQKKLDKIIENADRCGLSNIRPRINDATVFCSEFENAFDVVIADLPCSGLGTMGHKPEIKWRITDEDISALSALQNKMLNNAVRYVRPGGRLVFSTCTFTRAENINNTAFLAGCGLVKPVSCGLKLSGKDDYALLLMPVVHNVNDGFFISCFERI